MYNPFSPFGPTVETAGSTPFLTKHPVDLLLEGKVHDLPWITSATTEDGLYPAAGSHWYSESGIFVIGLHIHVEGNNV
jgi:hypothetical protein